METVQPPAASAPSARITPVVVHDGIAYVSGQLPRLNGELLSRGVVGTDVTFEEACVAATLCAEGCIAALCKYVGGGDVLRIIKITGFVASAPSFHAQGAVIDAASDVLLTRFGTEKGAHARSAIGVARLPHNAPVEIEMIAAVVRR